MMRRIQQAKRLHVSPAGAPLRQDMPSDAGASPLTPRGHRLHFHPVHFNTQAWGVMEAHNGNPKKARELFQQGAEKCEPHAPLFNAWAHFEARPAVARHPRPLSSLH